MIFALNDDVVIRKRGLRFGKILVRKLRLLVDVDIFDLDIVRVLARIFFGKVTHAGEMLAVGTVCVVVCRVIVREQVAVGKEIDCNVEAVVFVAETDTESRICVFADGIELCLSEVDPETDLFVNRGDDEVEHDYHGDEKHREDHGERTVLESFILENVCF